jgi:hypothetical protein
MPSTARNFNYIVRPDSHVKFQLFKDGSSSTENHAKIRQQRNSEWARVQLYNVRTMYCCRVIGNGSLLTSE